MGGDNFFGTSKISNADHVTKTFVLLDDETKRVLGNESGHRKSENVRKDSIYRYVIKETSF